jgi:putative Holliday junction resolvase
METKSGSWLSIDVGQKRVGLAIASEQARLPQSLPTLNNDNLLMSQIQALASQHNIIGVVVGLPRSLDGNETQQTRQIRDFADNLRQVLQLPLYFQDETLSSVRAREELESRKVAYNKEDVDALAAVYILTDWLAAHHQGELIEEK